MDMPARTFRGGPGGHRYGFNGKERDKDMNSLTAYDYGFRIYNPAIGKFLSVDPLTNDFPWNSPYSYAEGDPINFIDLDGLEQPTQRAAQTRVTIPVIELSTDMSIGPNGRIRDRQGTILLGNVPVNSGAYAPQSQLEIRLSLDEIYALIPPHAGASLSVDGRRLEISTANGRYSVPIYKKVEPKITTWVDRALARIQAEKFKQNQSTFTHWNNRGFYEHYTNDPSSLSDEYLEEVNKRIEAGIPTAQDMIYAQEVQKRKLDCKIGAKYENPGTHDPSTNKYVRTKSVLPANHEDLFKQSILASDGNRWTKVGKGKKAVYHRFFNSGNNVWHWSGSSNGKTKAGNDEIIKENEIPVDIKRLNEK